MGDVTAASFEAAVSNIMNPDNPIRRAAEEFLASCLESNVNFYVSALLHLCRSSSNEAVRSLSVILLKKVLGADADSSWTKLTPELQETVKRELLAAVHSETAHSVRGKLPYTVANLGARLVGSEEGNTWPELLPFLFQCTKSADPSHKVCSLLIFQQLSSFLLGAGLGPFLPVLVEVLFAALQDTDAKVRLAALQSSCSILLVLDDSGQISSMIRLLPLLISVINSSLATGDNDSASTAMEALIEVCQANPVYFKKNVSDLFTFMMQMATAKQVESSVRQLAMEFLLTLCEELPSMVRKVPNSVRTIFESAMQMVMVITDNPAWNTSTDADDEDTEISDHDIGLEALDRVALALGGKQTAEVAFSLLPTYISNPDWRARNAGLWAISQIAEGCKKQFATQLASIVSMGLSLFNDPHPRVRWAAMNCIAQMCTDFTGEVQGVFHSTIVPAYLKGLDDPVPRVAAHAAASLINYSDDCHPLFLVPYLPDLMSKMYSLLSTAPYQFVQEQIVSSIACIAEAAKTDFLPYYDTFVPLLKHIISVATTKETRKLRSRCIECMSMIGLSVGLEKFRADGLELIAVLTHAQSSAEADTETKAFFQTWTRVAKVMQTEFAPFLKHIMPALLASVSQKADVTIVEADQEPDDDDCITLNIKGLGDKRVSLRTSVLEEKSNSCQLIHNFIMDLKTEFYPYVEATVEAIIPLFKFPFMEDLRESSVIMVPDLLDVVIQHVVKTGGDTASIRKLFDHLFKEVMGAIVMEPVASVGLLQMESMKELIEKMGTNSLSTEQLTGLTEVLLEEFKNYSSKRADLAKLSKADDIDPDEKERIDEEQMNEFELLSSTQDVVSALIKTHLDIFFPVFESHFLPIFAAMLAPGSAPLEQRIAVCMMDDLVESAGTLAVKYYPSIAQALCRHGTDAHPDVRQSAVWGLGALAEFGGAHVAPYIPEAVAVLTRVLADKDAHESENAAATCNAASALWKYAHFQASAHPSCNPATLLPIWLDALPAEGDAQEAEMIYSRLVTHIENNDPIILGGPSMSNLPHILSIFAECVNTEYVTTATQNRIVALLRKLQATIPGAQLAAIWGGLEEKERAALSTALTAASE